MAQTAKQRASATHLITAENGGSGKTGTTLANYSLTSSCDLAQPSDGKRGTWGGARNRADRVSYFLKDEQVERLVRAAENALASGRIFQRHWTVHYGLAGIEPNNGARFVGKLLDLVSKQARREGGRLSAIWVRECASGKGEHVHILMHLPAGMNLRNRTRRWIVLAGGQYRAGVSKVTLIGGWIAKLEESRDGHTARNAQNVLRYVLKAGTRETGMRLDLARCGEAGAIVGKRCGFTKNLSRYGRY